MAGTSSIDQQMAELGIEEEENGLFILEGDVEEDVNRYELCLVERMLTEKNINVKAMKPKIADI